MTALPGRLYAIVGPDAARPDPVATARAMLDGGARIVQLRWKSASTRELLRAAEAIRELTRDAGAWLVVDDRLDVALACDADGVHLGKEDLPAPAARRILGSRILGVSTHDVAQAREAEAAGASYIGFGPVFATASKATGYDPRGLDRLREIRRAVRLPIVAIGGVDAERAASVLEAGADAAAMISALTIADDVAATVRAIIASLDSARRSEPLSG
jgi:thiamine-phosphate pyrophosphorylase